MMSSEPCGLVSSEWLNERLGHVPHLSFKSIDQLYLLRRITNWGGDADQIWYLLGIETLVFVQKVQPGMPYKAVIVARCHDDLCELDLLVYAYWMLLNLQISKHQKSCEHAAVVMANSDIPPFWT